MAADPGTIGTILSLLNLLRQGEGGGEAPAQVRPTAPDRPTTCTNEFEDETGAREDAAIYRDAEAYDEEPWDDERGHRHHGHRGHGDGCECED